MTCGYGSFLNVDCLNRGVLRLWLVVKLFWDEVVYVRGGCWKRGFLEKVFAEKELSGKGGFWKRRFLEKVLSGKGAFWKRRFLNSVLSEKGLT